jgi:glycerol kinase
MPISNHLLYLAIDQGGQSTRVALYDAQGQQLACFSAPSETHSYTNTEGGICVEQDPLEILACVRAGLARVAEFLDDDVTRIKAAGFAGQGSSMLCWHGQTGVALSPVLSWQDRRAETLLNALPLSQQQVREHTGLRISPHYGASKMRWCLDQLPAVQEAVKTSDACIGPIASYLFWHLLINQTSSKANCIDPGHAQRTLLWNLADNDWDQLLLGAFDISRQLLPACRWHNSHFGDLLVGKQSIPMRSCQRDQGASLFARGIPDAAACYVNIGTGAFIQRVSENLLAPEGLLVSPLWFPEPTSDAANIYAWEATVNGAAAALDWLAEQAGLADVTPNDIEQALALNPEQPIYLLNAVGGLSAPYWRTDVESRFSRELNPHEKILAWLESVIFQIVVNVELMQSAGEIQKIYISGGISKAVGVCQRLADLTSVAIYRSDNADATLQGIAYTAAAMPQGWRTNAVDEIFYPQNNAHLQERFVAWQSGITDWLR